MSYYILIILIVIGFLIWRKKREEANRQAIREHNRARNRDLKRQYENLRNTALETATHQMEADRSDGTKIIYGICLDYWEMGEIASFVAFWNGDCSIFFGTGPFIDRDFRDESSFGAAIEIVNISQKFLPIASPTENTPLPDNDEISLFLLTNVQRYRVSEKVNNTKNKDSAWFELLTNVEAQVSRLNHYGRKRT